MTIMFFGTKSARTFCANLSASSCGLYCECRKMPFALAQSLPFFAVRNYLAKSSLAECTK